MTSVVLIAARRLARLVQVAVLGSTSVPVAANAAALVVRVSGIAADAGEVGCTLFNASDADRFPMNTVGMPQAWQAASAADATCRFDNLPAGRYAVAVSQDLNGNRKVDTNFFGIPTEAWGVSNNVRPTMRAPRFDEAAIVVGSGASDVVVDIKVAK